MTKDQILTIIEEIFRRELGNNAIVLSGESTPVDIDEWDSLNQMNLVKAIEARFEIKFNLSEILEFEKVNHIIDAIIEKTD